jgi:hypothetical protein
MPRSNKSNKAEYGKEAGSGKERSYLNPEFDTDIPSSVAELKESISWNYDLAKRKIKRIINQRAHDKEWEKEHPKPPKKEPGLGLGRTASLLEEVDD